MLALLIVPLLAIAATFLAYRFSPSAKLKARIQRALSPFEGLDSEVRSQEQTVKRETESQTTHYIDGVYSSRLKALPVDDLKKYATGMRLQALKDVGIRTVADLQGWGEYRVAQVRGVGPKSANAIVRSVAAATKAAKAIPIPGPSSPFATDSERQLMQALYRRRWFGVHISDQATAFATTLASHQRTRDEILANTTFSKWLWKFGANATILRSAEQAESLIGALEDGGLNAVRENLSESVTECRAILANRVPQEKIVQDFTEERAFYDAYLTSRFGTPANNASERRTSVPETRRGVVRVDSLHEPRSGITEAGNSRITERSQPRLEELVSVSVGSASGSGAIEFTLPPPPRPLEPSDVRWLGKGEPAQIQGHNLPYGYIYVGKGIDKEQHFAVNPRLPAKSGDLAAAETTGYYSSYHLLSPERRAIYLTWLSEGASTPTQPDFGMLYFYGLERRVLDLLQNRVPAPPDGELEQLLQEISRLANLFAGKPGSVAHCCNQLLDFSAACRLDKTSVPELPTEWAKTWELPFIVRYGIGWFMKNRKAIPVEWAFRWASVEPSIYLRTPATRCPQEFQAAFAVIYRKKFGEGLILAANKTKLKVSYQAGWPMYFRTEVRNDFSDIPDVTALSTPRETLKALVEEATAEIDGYSRYLGRNPAKTGTLEAFLNLPLQLWPAERSGRWREFLGSFVEPIQPGTLESFLREVDPSGDPGLAKTQEIVRNLDRALVGFEPDILAGARRPKPSDMVVLFPLTSGSTIERDTPDYKKAALIVSLSACVALADGHASKDEADAIEAMIASWQHLHNDLRTRLRAQYRLQVYNRICLANVKSRLASLAADARLQLAQSLCSLAAADGNIAAAEVKLLEQIYSALDLDSKLLYSHLHGGPQPLRDADAGTQSRPSERSAYVVDSARLATLRRETEQVNDLLAGVFAEEEPANILQTQAVSFDSPVSTSLDDVLLPGLDPTHQRFLAELLGKASWTRSELEVLAAQSKIMLDGALERINDAAFDLIGEPITEGDDPVYVQQNVLEAAE